MQSGRVLGGNEEAVPLAGRVLACNPSFLNLRLDTKNVLETGELWDGQGVADGVERDGHLDRLGNRSITLVDDALEVLQGFLQQRARQFQQAQT